MTYTDEIIEIVREIPGVTVAEMMELMPHAPKGSVSSLPTQLERRGIFVAEQVKSEKSPKGFIKKYRINDVPRPVARPIKLKQATQNGIDATVAELRARILELQAWKAEAIARYPELGVPPNVAKARKIVANELRARGDNGLARNVEQGGKDDILPMKVAISILESMTA